MTVAATIKGENGASLFRKQGIEGDEKVRFSD